MRKRCITSLMQNLESFFVGAICLKGCGIPKCINCGCHLKYVLFFLGFSSKFDWIFLLYWEAVLWIMCTVFCFVFWSYFGLELRYDMTLSYCSRTVGWELFSGAFCFSFVLLLNKTSGLKKYWLLKHTCLTC